MAAASVALAFKMEPEAIWAALPLCAGQWGRNQLLKLRRVGLLAAVREHARAELHHDAGDVFEQFASHGSLVTNTVKGVEAVMSWRSASRL